jgi:hypothetical protein
MPEILMQKAVQAPAPARASSALDAEAAQLDARLQVAAKKAALASLEAQARTSGPETPATAPTTASGTIRIDYDGKTITLENPTEQQLALIGVARRTEPDLQGWQVVSLAATVMSAIVGSVALILWHRRRMRGMAVPAASAASDQRMARIENAVESIALEVERISEGQRFTARMLAEGAAANIAVPQRDATAMQIAGEESR